MTIITKTFAIAAISLGASWTVSNDASAQEPFIGELRELPYNFCPRGWTEADGKMLPIAQHQALFSLLGTEYGGDGRTTFALPDMRVKTTTSPPPASGEVKIYQHCGYAGWDQSVGLGNYQPGEFGSNASFVDNDASSLKISPSWVVTIYDGPNFDGESMTLSGNVSCLVGEGFNDRLSSIQVRHNESPPVTTVDQGSKVKTCIALMGIFPSRN